MTSLRHCATFSVAAYLAILFAAPHAAGFEPTSGHGHKPPLALPASGTVQAAFTPGDDAGKLIADALIAAKRRGVEVKVIADKDQTHRIPTSLISKIAAEGVPVFTDSDHTSAHNKVIVIDADSPDVTLITGSFNFTHAAQYRNAENVLLIRGNAALTDLYVQNWHRHYKHSQPYR